MSLVTFWEMVHSANRHQQTQHVEYGNSKVFLETSPLHEMMSNDVKHVSAMDCHGSVLFLWIKAQPF